MKVTKRTRATAGAALLGLCLWGLLFFNAAWQRASWDLGNLGHSRRYWETMTVATAKYQQGTSLSLGGRPWDWMAVHVEQKLYDLVPQVAARQGIRPWQFWRTVPLRPFDTGGDIRIRDDEDVGRTWLSTMGFTVLGGVAPYLPLWLGVLACLPLFLWTSIECARVGRSRVAALLLGLCASSAYVAEQLTLPYSAAGFHFVGLLALVPLSVYVFLAPAPAWRGLIGRWLLAGVLFCVCVLCRGTVRAFLPAYAVLAVVGAIRLIPAGLRHRRWGVAGAAVLSLGLLVSPHLLLEPPSRHYAWMGIWEGLGDFDREKGFAWSDGAARSALRGAGYVFEGAIQPGSNEEQDAIYRRLVLRAISSDPVWYLKILAQRVPATLLQLRLWPRAAIDGRSFALGRTASEGEVDLYYGLTRTADWYGLGAFWVELPLPLLWAPLLLLMVLWLWSRGRTALGAGAMGIVGVVSLAALATPVAIATGSGPEMQAFCTVYLLAAGLVVDGVWRLARRGSAPQLADGV
jgi:hypothetical protein